MNENLATLAFVLNGNPVELSVSPGRSLLEVIREDLGLKGTKEGCSRGHCGTCSVLVNGDVKLACRTDASAVAGKTVITIEGLGSRDDPHPLQRAFVEAGAVQCGFCTPGAVISAKALLDREPDPSRDEVLKALNRNLCRCTGYVKFVDAVRLASRYMREGVQAGGAGPAAVSAESGGNDGPAIPGGESGGDGGPAVSEGGSAPGALGRSLPRRDAWEKVFGTAVFAADIQLPGLHHVKVLRSAHDHARIAGINVEAAMAVPGVVRVITARDVPGRNAVAIFRPDQPILAGDVVRHRGEPVALVVAETVAAAEAGRDLIEVEWEPLPAVMTPAEALAPGAPQVHDDVPNDVFTRRLSVGNAAEAIETAHTVVRGRFTTPYNEHAYMEPEAGVGYVENGRVAVMVGTQSAQHCRTEIAKVLALDPDAVRVVQTVTGGGFGGKLDIPFPAMVALAAYVSGVPVRLVLSREESFLDSTKRHPFEMDLALAADADGTLRALTVDLTANTGAYMSFGAGVVTRAVVHVPGPYRIPNIEVCGRAVHTNGPVSGAMRGFGVPQVTFAMESLMDDLAAGLNVDPLELRRINGYVGSDLTATGQQLESAVPYLATLDALAPVLSAAQEDARRFNESAEDLRAGRRRGVGLASMWFGPGKTSLPERSYAFLELLADGGVQLVTTAADVGQGLETVMAQIAAEELGMPYERVTVRSRDTDGSPDGGFTCASRQTYNTGNAVLVAARSLKQSVVAAAAELMGADPRTLRVLDGEVQGDGDQVTFADLVTAGHTRRYFGSYAADVSDLDENGQGRPYETYTFGSQVAEVEVDLNTGAIEVLAVHVAHDVGTIINPQAVQGQLEGGVLMGVGFALKEEFVPGETLDLGSYRVPRARETPFIEILPLQTPHERGPFGAAGAGECSQMPTAPAVANAVFSATGRRMSDLPITAARMWSALGGSVSADG